jgi:hypothetical protein
MWNKLPSASVALTSAAPPFAAIFLARSWAVDCGGHVRSRGRPCPDNAHAGSWFAPGRAATRPPLVSIETEPSSSRKATSSLSACRAQMAAQGPGRRRSIGRLRPCETSAWSALPSSLSALAAVQRAASPRLDRDSQSLAAHWALLEVIGFTGRRPTVRPTGVLRWRRGLGAACHGLSTSSSPLLLPPGRHAGPCM